jgi:putative endonuclease
MKYYTYVLISKRDNSYYIGSTQNTEKRLHKHNDGQSKFTKSRRPYKLIFKKVFDTRREAVKYERYLKSLKKRVAIERAMQST